MRSHKYRHNYHKDYLAMKRGTYDYSKIYRVFHKHGTILEYLNQDGMILKPGVLYTKLG
jgi:hypothetical protein